MNAQRAAIKPAPAPERIEVYSDKTVTLTGTDRWAACSATEFGHLGERRHIVARGALTTVCGATATHSQIWRANSTKPVCPNCIKRYSKDENR